MSHKAMLTAALIFVSSFISAEINWVDQNQEMVFLVKQGKSHNAIETGRILVQDIRSEFAKMGKVSADAVVFLVNQGIICKQNKVYESAREALELAAQCKSKIASFNDPLFVTIYKALGETLQAMNHSEEAEKYFLKALKVKEINLGPNHPDCIPLYFSIADFYQAISKNSEALKLFQKALEISKAKNGEESSKTAEVYFNIGEYYYKLKQYQEAEENFLRAFGIYDRNNDNKKLASVYDYLGALNKLKGDLKDAESYYRLSVKNREMTAGKNSIDYAKSLNNLASIYLMQENREAENLLKESLKICETILGEKHPSLMPVLANLVHYYTKNNNPVELENYKKRMESLSR